MNPVTASDAIRAALRDVAIRVWHQTTPITEHGQGASWAVGEFRRIVAEEPDTYFDRYLCPDPCGTMHTRCAGCGRPVDGCPHEQLTAVSVPAPAPTDEVAEVAKHVTRAIFALKTPSPDGSKHYQSGWDDGLEAAMDAARDAALAVLPAPADRAAIEAAAYRAAANYVRGNSADERYGKASISTAMCTVADELYRWAAAAASGSGRVADETQARSDIGTEFVQQADHPDTAALDAADAEVRTLTQLAAADPEYQALLLSRGRESTDPQGAAGSEQPAVVSQPDGEA